MNAGFSDSARRLYDSARLDRPAWLPWTRLSSKVRDTWGEAVYLAALEAAHTPPQPLPGPVARAGAENAADGRTALPGTVPAPPPPDAALRAALADGG